MATEQPTPFLEREESPEALKKFRRTPREFSIKQSYPHGTVKLNSDCSNHSATCAGLVSTFPDHEKVAKIIIRNPNKNRGVTNQPFLFQQYLTIQYLQY